MRNSRAEPVAHASYRSPLCNPDYHTAHGTVLRRGVSETLVCETTPDLSPIFRYARASTGEQTLDLQPDALTKDGGDKLFIETASGTKQEALRLAARAASPTHYHVESVERTPTVDVTHLRHTWLLLQKIDLVETRESYHLPHRSGFPSPQFGLLGVPSSHHCAWQRRKNLPHRGLGQ